MPRFLMGWVLSLGLAAIALVLCGILLSGFQIEWPWGYIWAVVIFAILNAIFPALVQRLLRKGSDGLTALTGLVSAFLALLGTVLITSIFDVKGLTISGFWTWVWATLIVWVLSMVIWAIPGPWRAHARRQDRRG
jgi:uncharacterized membrane protein YvlD (DUF360 family)